MSRSSIKNTNNPFFLQDPKDLKSYFLVSPEFSSRESSSHSFLPYQKMTNHSSISQTGKRKNHYTFLQRKFYSLILKKSHTYFLFSLLSVDHWLFFPLKKQYHSENQFTSPSLFSRSNSVLVFTNTPWLQPRPGTPYLHVCRINLVHHASMCSLSEVSVDTVVSRPESGHTQRCGHASLCLCFLSVGDLDPGKWDAFPE